MAAQDMASYMQKRRADRRARLVELLGGTCSHSECSTTEKLEFDHKDPASREFRLNGKNLDKPWKVLLDEVAKCQLLCFSHHREKTIAGGEIQTVEHGGGVSGKKNCQCVPCRSRKAEYMRAYGHPSRVTQLAE